MKQSIRTILTLSMLSVFAVPSFAQETLTLDDAIQAALRQSFGILTAQNDALVAENSATAGNANLLPKVDANAGYNASIKNTQLVFAGENPPVEVDNARTESISGSVGLSYTVFNGLANVKNFQRLKLVAEQGELQARALIENTLYSLTQSYYQVAQLQENLQVQAEAVELSRDRLDRALLKQQYGGSNRLDVLSAEVDFNTDTVAYLSLQLQYDNARRNLSFLMGAALNKQYEVETAVALDTTLSLDALTKEARQNNAQLLLAKAGQRQSYLDLQIAQAGRMPQLNLNAQYGYDQSNSDANIVLENTSSGFSGGLALTYGLYNGGQRNTQIQNARINQQSKDLEYAEALLSLERDMLNAHEDFRNKLYIIDIEEYSKATAERNYQRASELFSLGQLNNTQLREAQVNLSSALKRYNDARYNAKVAEIRLMQLSGKLLAQGA